MTRLSLSRSKNKSSRSTLSVAGSGISSVSEAHEGLDELRAALDGTHAKDPAAPVPQRWLDECNGDEKVARGRWRAMAEWREVHDVDGILEREQREFFLIKRAFPQYWLGNDAEGNLVSLQLMRDTRKRVDALRKAGITPERFARHQQFMTEYAIKHGLTRTGRIVDIIDVKDTPIFSQMFGKVSSYFEPASVAMRHYPDLTHSVYFVNVSFAYRMAWNVSSMFLDRRERESFHLLNSAAELPEDVLPPLFRGHLTQDLQHVGLESALSRFVRHANAQHSEASGQRYERGASMAVMDVEPAVLNGEEAVREAIIGKWVKDASESQSFDPVLKAQGLNWVNRKAAAMLPMSQEVRIDADDGDLFFVRTRTGPDIEDSSGPINGGTQTPAGKKKVPVTVDMVSRPSFLDEISCSPVIRLTYDLSSGDKRIVYHGIHRYSRDKKILSIEYHVKSKGPMVIESARSILVFHRVRPHPLTGRT